ncbi:hypothetical protein ACOMHN_065773 [Nucella lapillus]
MAISPSLWYSNYKGAVFPVDLQAPPALLRGKARHVKTLVELAAAKIVQSSDMTGAALTVIPKTLYEPLMMEALFKNHELAVQRIIAWWPGPALVLRDMVPELFTSVQPLYNMEYLTDIVKQGLRYTTSLAHTFLDVLKRQAYNSKTRLRFLDLTGFPTAEVILYFLATHCMLAHNEVRHEAIRTMYKQAQQQASDRSQMDNADMEPMEPMEHSLPPDCCITVKLDAFITSESTHSEVCKALKVSSFNNRKLSIVIGRLAVTCLGEARVSLLLKQIQPQYLTGLQLQYNALTAFNFVHLAPTLKTLVNLESLDLACNGIFFYQHEEACVVAAQVFEALPRLRRLDLSNSRIKTRLRRLLEGVAQPLTFLRLAACSLTVTDLVYLAHSIHRTQLTELDLSENNLSQCDRQLKEVVSGSRTTLRVLELEDSNLDAANIYSLVPSLSQLSNLMFVNFSQLRLSQDCLVSLLTALGETVTLQVFKASYCVECYEMEGEEDQRKAAMLAELNQVSNRSSVHTLRLKPLTLFLSELDRLLEAL